MSRPRKGTEVEKGKAVEWLFVTALFAPVMILGKLRMHQQDLARFLILSILTVTVIWLVYAIYCTTQRKKQDGAGTSGKDPS